MPAVEQLDAPVLFQRGGEDPVHFPVALHVVQAVPVLHRETGEVCRAEGGGLDAARADHVAADQVGLELHQEVVRAGAAVDLQLADVDTGVALHGADDVIGLIGQRFQRGADQVGTVEPAGQTDDRASGALVPVRRAESRKGRDHIAARRILHSRGIFRALRRRGDHAELVAQPLDRGTGDEH